MAVFINLGLNVILIPVYQNLTGNGAIGAAFSQLFTEVIIGVCGCIIMGTSIIDKNLVIIVLKSLLAALVMAAVTWLLRDQFVLIPIIVGGLTYCILAIPLFGLDVNIRQIFKKVRFQRVKVN